MECKILQLLLFVCMKLLVSGVGAGAEVTCIERERQALLKFKESLTGGDISELTWGSEDDKGECCDWYGVGCSKADVDFGHVYSIELPDLHLTGNISKISPALRELQHLGTLFLSNNNFTIDNLNWLSDVSSLSYLDLSGINLSSVTNWVHPITNLSSLEELYLRGCQLRDTLSALDHPSSLKILDLSYNQISGSLLDLRAFSSLQQLVLSGNQLIKLPKFEKLSNLESLRLSSTSLEDTITEHHLSNLTQLTELDLSYNNVPINLSFDWIPPFQLNALYLDHCNLGPYVPNWIRTQNSLEFLSLSFAGISDTLPDWLWNMSSIKVLDLSHNQISGGIPHFHSELNHYLSLDLSYNNLSGPIPSSVIQCSEELKLSGNMLSGSIFNICTISENCTIEHLILSDNQLDGELPDCWMNLKLLIVLNLANNKLSGKIPPTLSTLEYLMILHLGNNSSLVNCLPL